MSRDPDSVALEAASSIVHAVDNMTFPGGDVQLKAHIQCIVYDAIHRANTPDSAAQGAIGDRERFESTLKKKRGFYEYHFERNDDGTYSRDHVEGYWHIWQLAQPSDATAQPSTEPIDFRIGWKLTLEEAIQPIYEGAKLLTDAELNDPEYMRAYISGMHETIEDMKAAQPIDLTDERAVLQECIDLAQKRLLEPPSEFREIDFIVALGWIRDRLKELLANTAQGKPDQDTVDAQRYRYAVANGVILFDFGSVACVGRAEADTAIDTALAAKKG